MMAFIADMSEKYGSWLYFAVFYADGFAGLRQIANFKVINEQTTDFLWILRSSLSASVENFKRQHSTGKWKSGFPVKDCT